MKILNFVVLLLLSVASASAQVAITQPPGTYTNNSIILRDGTANKVKNAPTLTYASDILTVSDNSSTASGITINSGTGVGDTGRVKFDIGTGHWMQLAYTGDLFALQGRAGDTFDVFKYNNSGSGTNQGMFDIRVSAIAPDLTIGSAASAASGNAINLLNGAQIGWEVNPAGTDATLGVNSSNVLVSSANVSAPSLISTVATGIAPLTVASTTQVANLNAATAGASTNVGITNDTTTNATMYPLWVTANTGNLPAKVSSTKLSFNPSTGVVDAAGFSSGAGGSVAGYTAYAQGTATTAPTSSVGFQAPTTVSTKYMITLPAAPATGVVIRTGATDPTVESVVAPGSSGNVLTSNGTTWTSAAPAGGSVAGSDTQIQYNNSGAFGANAGLTVNKTSGAVTQTQTSLGGTTTAGLSLVNSTAATNGTQQNPPSLLMDGFGYGTTAGTSQRVAFSLNVLPVQSTVPTGTFRIQSAIAGGALTDRLTITSGGTLNVSGAGIFGAGIDVTGSYTTSASGGGFAAGATGGLNWGGSKSYIKSSADGVIEMTNFAATASAAVKMGMSVSAKASSPYTVLATDGRTTFTNEGAAAQITFNLPTAVAGYNYTFYVQDADGILIVASSGDTIRFGGTVTASGGDIVSTTIGSAITLTSINATEWVATSVVGTWAD